jgi:hypothetical protein
MPACGFDSDNAQALQICDFVVIDTCGAALFAQALRVAGQQTP